MFGVFDGATSPLIVSTFDYLLVSYPEALQIVVLFIGYLSLCRERFDTRFGKRSSTNINSFRL